MKKIALIAAATLFSASSAFAGSAVGTWKSPTNDKGASIQVKISPCGSKFCGTIVSVKNGDSSIVGKRMIWDMVDNGGGSYSGGKVWAPDNKKTYTGKLSLSGNKLKISGCVLGGSVCRGENFTRVK